jgi:WD40 repeat protein
MKKKLQIILNYFEINIGIIFYIYSKNLLAMKERVHQFSIKKALFLILVLFTYSAYAQNIETVLQMGHYAKVNAVAYSPTGKFIATGSTDKTIKLWKSNDGKEIRTFIGANSSIITVEFNKQESLLLSVGNNGDIIVWDINTGNIIKRFSIENDKYTCASFHPTESRIITGSEKSGIVVWDYKTGDKIMQLKAEPVTSDAWGKKEFTEAQTVTYSANGEYIIAGSIDRTAIVWDAKTGKELKKYHQSRYDCSGCLEDAFITPDNKYVLSANSDSVQIFDFKTGKLLNGLTKQSGSINSLSISTDGKYVSAVQYGSAYVWDFKTGKVVFESDDKTHDIISVSISPDSKYLVTGNEMRTANIYNISNGKLALTLKGYLNQIDERLLSNSFMYWASMVNEAKLSKNGKYMAVGRTGNNAKLIDFNTGKIHKTLNGHNSMVLSICFSNDSKYFVTGGLDGKVVLWNVETGAQIRKFNYEDANIAVFSVDVSNDNKLLATADWSGYVNIWDIETGKHIKSIKSHGGSAAYHIKFTPNGLYIISAGLDRKLKLIETDTGEEVRTFIGHTDLVNSIDIDSATNKIITSSWDNTIRVWDFYSGLQTLKINAHNGGVYSARFDTSGKYIVSGGDDYLVKLWDATNGTLISSFAGHKGGIGDVYLTKDNKNIISGSRDGSIRVWDTNLKKELVSLTFLNDNDWFIKTPEGYFDASEGAYGSISFVKGTELYSIEQFFNKFYRPGVYTEALNYKVQAFRDNVFNSIEKSPPPTVEFVSPENDTDFPKDMVTCMVKVTNNGGGVNELRVMQNGKRLVVDDSDLKRMKKEGQYTMKTFDVSLLPGENEISVSAYSNDEIESKEANIKLLYKGLQKTSNCYIISIGINKYENEDLNLNFARSDAQAVSKLLNNKGSKLFNKVFTYELFDKDATKEKILATLDEVATKIKKEDVFVFFYAGHGSTFNDVFYFIPTGCTGLYQEEKLEKAINVKVLQDKFKAIQALKQVVFVDACHSGTSVDLLAMRGAVEEKALAQLSRSTGIHVMASSEGQQQSAKVQSLGHGVFTYILLEALQGKADGTPKDSKVTVYEIKSYIDDQVPDMSYKLIHHKQFPSTFSVGHDFPLVTE